MAVWKPCLPEDSGRAVPVLFLDRDGVVIANQDYLSDPDLVALVPGAAEAMKAAACDGYLLVGVSNQSGLGRGFFSEKDLARVMTRLDELLAAEGARFDGFYYCPHAPQEDCRCRKPGPGLLEEVAQSLTFDPGRSWVVGDKASDVALGRDHGMGAVLVLTGHGPNQVEEVRRRWDGDPRVQVADDLGSAYALIQNADRSGETS